MTHRGLIWILPVPPGATQPNPIVRKARPVSHCGHWLNSSKVRPAKTGTDKKAGSTGSSDRVTALAILTIAVGETRSVPLPQLTPFRNTNGGGTLHALKPNEHYPRSK